MTKHHFVILADAFNRAHREADLVVDDDIRAERHDALNTASELIADVATQMDSTGGFSRRKFLKGAGHAAYQATAEDTSTGQDA